MLIRDETNNQQHAPGLTGPFDEDSRVTLTCEVDPLNGEQQHAQLAWWQLQSVLPTDLATPTMLAQRHTPTQQTNFSLPDESQATLSLLTTLHFTRTATNSDYTSAAAASDNFGQTTEGEYFVGFGPNEEKIPFAQQSLPAFAERAVAFKRWLRVQDQLIQVNSESNKPQASIQLALNRANLADEYICLANNNHFSPPINASVKINLNRKCYLMMMMSK